MKQGYARLWMNNEAVAIEDFLKSDDFLDFDNDSTSNTQHPTPNNQHPTINTQHPYGYSSTE
ncbi:MAG: hypothetical protein IKT22_04445, partial [Prevotella sp.]|nr:hypothetical protein [Prevotella sp.]